MSKNTEVTRWTSPSTGRARGRPPRSAAPRPRSASGARPDGDGDEQAGAQQRAGVDGCRLVELVPAAGEVAHHQRQAGDQAGGETATGLLCPVKSR